MSAEGIRVIGDMVKNQNQDSLSRFGWCVNSRHVYYHPPIILLTLIKMKLYLPSPHAYQTWERLDGCGYGYLGRVNKLDAESGVFSFDSVWTPQRMDRYCLVSHKLRKCISTLELGYLSQQYQIDDKADDFMTFLADYINLENLSVVNNYASFKRNLPMFVPLNTCPQVTCYEYKSALYVCEDVSATLLEPLLDAGQSNVIHTRLKFMKLELVNLPKSYLLCMRLFIPSLATLDLEVAELGYTIEQFTQENLPWVNHLSDIPNCKLRLISVTIMETHTYEGLGQMWTFVKKLRRN